MWVRMTLFDLMTHMEELLLSKFCCQDVIEKNAESLRDKSLLFGGCEKESLALK